MQRKNDLYHNPVIPLDQSMCHHMIHYVSYADGPLEGGLQPWQYTGWRDEEVSWHETAYIHTLLNPSPTYRIWGPDALEFLSKYCANSFKHFPIGGGKHGIMCDEHGRDMIDGLLLRTGEDEFITYWMAPWIQFLVETCGMKVEGENLTGKVFFFQLGGPKTLEVLEAASGDNLHDIKFIHHRMSKIAGKDVRICRIGMAGSLAYEVHGNTEDGPVIYEQILKAGERYGLRRLGNPAYNMTHWENGFPQAYLDFPLPWFEYEAFAKWLRERNLGVLCDGSVMISALMGSMEGDFSARYRNPIELGWEKTINFDHDFLGKEALQKILAGPHRKMVTLEWNKEDILDIHHSQLEPGEPYKDIAMPDDISWGFPGYHADKVVNEDGKTVGISTGRMLAWFYREMISICSIDAEYSNLGTEVFVVWGEPGTRQKKIRARVARYPYHDTDRNEKVDVSKIPVGTMD